MPPAPGCAARGSRKACPALITPDEALNIADAVKGMADRGMDRARDRAVLLLLYGAGCGSPRRCR